MKSTTEIINPRLLSALTENMPCRFNWILQFLLDYWWWRSSFFTDGLTEGSQLRKNNSKSKLTFFFNCYWIIRTFINFMRYPILAHVPAGGRFGCKSSKLCKFQESCSKHFFVLFFISGRAQTTIIITLFNHWYYERTLLVCHYQIQVPDWSKFDWFNLSVRSMAVLMLMYVEYGVKSGSA